MRRALVLAALAAAAACGGGKSAGPARPSAAAHEELGPPVKLEELKGNVVSIDVVGMSAERAARAREPLAKNIGTPFDRVHVAGWLHFVTSLSGVADVRAEARPAQGGVAVRLVVVEHPKIRTVDVRGSHAVPASEWLNRMGIKEGDYLDPVLATSRRRDMVDMLHQFGHFSADVAWSVEKAADGRVDLVFTVEEGPAVKVAKIDIKGNKAVKREAVLDILSKNGGTTVGARYWREALSNAILHLTSRYFDLGYINVQVDNPEETLSADKTSMALAITIREGDRFRVGKLDAKGALVAPASEYLKLLGVKSGEVFNRSKIASGLERINEMHKSKGRPMEVFPQTEIDSKKKTVAITLQVQGPAAAPQPAPAAP
jgi:outer membrane protein assembly factor BamA